MVNKVLGGGPIDGQLGVNPDWINIEADFNKQLWSIDEQGRLVGWIVETAQAPDGNLLANGLYANPAGVVSDSDVDNEQIESNSEAIKALLIAQGLSGNYGFFAGGFTYGEIGDVGINTDGKIYTYAGVDSLPVTVAAGTDPVGDSDYRLERFNYANHIQTSLGNNVQNKIDQIPSIVDYGATEGVDSSSEINNALAASKKVQWTSGVFDAGSELTQIGGGLISGDGKRFSGQLNVTHSGTGLTLDDGGSVERVYIRRDTQFEGTGVDSPATSKWNTVKEMQIARHGIGLHLKNYYHNVENVIFTENDVALKVGHQAGSSGAVNVKGSHFRENKIGLEVDVNTNQVWCFGNTFEFNRYHLKVNQGSSLSMWGAYLGDPPEVVLQNFGGKVFIDLGGYDQAVSGSTTHIEDLVADNPYVNYPIFCIESSNNSKTEISNGVIGVNQQIRQDNGTKTLVGAVLSAGGTYKLNNVRFYIGEGAMNGSIYTNEISDSATVINHAPITNYISNGNFQDETKAVDPAYVERSGVTVVSGIRNPWGGAFLNIPQSGIKVKYKIPPRLVGKKMLLMFMAGENLGASNFGVRLDGINSDLEISSTTTGLTKYPSVDVNNSIYRPFSYKTIPDGRKFAALTRIEVTSQVEEGVLNFFVTGGNFTLGSLILCELDYGAEDGFPYGFFEQLDPILL